MRFLQTAKVFIFFITISLIGYFTLTHVSIDYKVRSTGLLLPAREWSLSRTIEGNLISSFKDNIQGSVNTYNVTEFSRGDVVEFRLNEKLFIKGVIQKGDTIGRIYSNEEQRKLLQLEGELEILGSELLYVTTGQKPEDVEKAYKQYLLATQEYETEKLLMTRTEELYKDSVIATQQYEVELNKLKVKELEKEVALANYESITVGEKPEQEILTQSKITALKMQIDQLQDRLDYFTIISPVNGIVMKNSTTGTSSMLLKIYDTTRYVIISPIEIFERQYVKTGNKTLIKSKAFDQGIEGELVKLDNIVQVLNSKQAVYSTILIEENTTQLLGEYSEVEIVCENISLFTYFKRIFNLTMSR